MNSIEDQSSDDSSHLPIFNPEPGTSLANAIGEQMLPIHSNERIRTISSTESNNDSERQSLNEIENRKLTKKSSRKKTNF
jgi:hypothetical protein